jgi:hypothetical protein
MWLNHPIAISRQEQEGNWDRLQQRTRPASGRALPSTLSGRCNSREEGERRHEKPSPGERFRWEPPIHFPFGRPSSTTETS